MKQEKQALILVIILAILTVGILTLIILNSKGGTSNFEYNNYKIQQVIEGNYVGYRTEVFINGRGPYFMNTRYNPRDLEDIVVEERLRPYLDNKTELFIHITGLNESFRSETTIAALEFDGLIERFYSIPVKYEDNIKDCSDAINDTLVVDFRLGEENRVYVDNNCIIAEGITQDDFIRLADRMIFHLLEIMTN